MDDLGGVVAALSLAEYQDGAITSRTILKEKGGSLTFFSFAKDQALSEHTTPFEAMVHVLEGQAEVTIDGRPHTVAAGEVLRLPASVPHALRAIERFKMLLVMIAKEK